MIADLATEMVEPPQPRCIGVPLKPFTLGHLLLLRRIRNSYVLGEYPQYQDLISAALICTHTWEENLKLLSSPLRRWLTMKLWGLLAGKFNVAVQTIVLLQHIQHGQEMADIKRTTGGVRYLVSEWETRLYAYLRTLHYTESEILNMPLRLANMLFVTHLEEDGLMDFRSRRDEVQAERMTKIVEEMERADKEGFAV